MKKIVPWLLILGCVLPTFLHIKITINNKIDVHKGSHTKE